MAALVVSLSVSLASVPSVARAEPADTSKEEAARTLYREGIHHYDVAEYEEAIASFRQAYFLTSAPELLFDIAQSYRLRGPGHCRSALQFYRNYLRIEPKSPQRKSVEAAIADMEECSKTETPVASEADQGQAATPSSGPSTDATRAPPPPDSPRPRASTTAPIVVGASGLGLTLVGGGLFAWSRLRYDAISREGCAPECDPNRTDVPRVTQTVGGVLIGVGATLVVTGVVMWLLKPRHASTTAWTTSPLRSELHRSWRGEFAF